MGSINPFLLTLLIFLFCFLCFLKYSFDEHQLMFFFFLGVDVFPLLLKRLPRMSRKAAKNLQFPESETDRRVASDTAVVSEPDVKSINPRTSRLPEAASTETAS
jgi:hypothetical protein